MPRFLTISFVALALFIGAAGAAPAAQAQGVCQEVDATTCISSGGTFDDTNCTCTERIWDACQTNDQCASGVCTRGVCTAASTVPPYDLGHTCSAPAECKTGLTCDNSKKCVAKPAAAGGTADPSVGASTDGTKNTATLPAPPPGTEQFGPIMTAIMTLFAWLVGVAAITLDNVVYYTVVTMGDYVKHLSAVGVSWRILRDIGNIAFIFGFLAIGISVILDVNWYGGGTKLLPKLLIAAIFLNFSLFITEAVIDTGNLFATQFYTQINGGQAAGVKNFGISEINNEGISNKIMNTLGLQSIYGNGAATGDLFKPGNTWIIGFMGIILFIITAFVMFSLAFILVARFIILIFVIILAPIGFVGFAIPQLNGIAKQWRDKLIEQTITAPVLFLMLYIALAVITDTNFLTGFGGKPDWTGFVTGNLVGFASTILSFLVAMGLLLAVTMSAKKLGAAGAGWATKAAGGLTFGATAWAARSTIGAGSQRISRAIRTGSLGGTKFGRVLAGTFDRGAKGSFDIRGSKAWGALGSTPLGKIDAGDAQKGGYRARQEASVKGHQDYIKTVGEAIEERGATKEEQEVIDKMEAEAAAKRTAFQEAEKEHKATKEQLDPQIALQTAEVKRLEKIEADRLEKAEAELAQLEKEKDEEFKTTFGVSLATEQKIAAARQNLTAKDAENEKKLEEAQQNLSKSKGDLAEAFNKESKAKDELAKAEEKETEANKKSGNRIKEDKKKAQLAYAENAKGVVSWAAYGPGGSMAAKKIIKDSKKNPDKEFSKKLRKAMEDSEKEDTGKEKEKPKEEEKKPEAPVS